MEPTGHDPGAARPATARVDLGLGREPDGSG
jgi:hypothetical protein